MQWDWPLQRLSLIHIYGIYEVHEDWVLQSVIKTNPDYLKCNTNAALVAFALERYFGDGFSIKYLTNGTKNVLHETNYHEYLMKYFGFRKAYCRLHIKYRGLSLIHICTCGYGKTYKILCKKIPATYDELL